MTGEVERKWRVRRPPADLGAGTRIRQGYLAVGADEVRVRQKGGDCRLTLKRGSGLVRTEVEVALTDAQFRALWPSTEGRRIEKVRHDLRYSDRTIELDVFEAHLDGLMVAEVEFPDVAAAAAFVPPPWFDEELTGVDGWSNARLAVDGLPL